MSRLNITAKIWLSIGVFVLGYVLSTSLAQIQGRSAELSLRATSDALFPAAQRSQEAESAFQKMVKGFSDAVMTQDAGSIEKASNEGTEVVAGLEAMAKVKGLSPERSRNSAELAVAIRSFLADAKPIYSAVLADPAALTAEMQTKMRSLADRTETTKTGLQKLKDDCSRDLRGQLDTLQQASQRQRWVGLGLFAATLAISAVIVSLTIKRAITGPIVSVIEGVQQAAEEAAQTSEKMSESGRLVSRDAQEQAACVEETSAALEEISATTRQNANRATEADSLMRGARETVEKASKVMQDLTRSMEAISKSSNQVASVLKSIDEIAFHTNILALNAAVEAARAGEAGAGFSVVADEVRNLAQRAAEAARSSADIVEKTIADVSQGVQFVDVADAAFAEVSGTIARGSSVVSEIAASSEEQARGVTHIGQSIARIEAVTQNNAANAHATAEAAAAMSEQSQATRAHLEHLVAVVGLKSA